MKIKMAIVHPEIIVVENAMTFDTNALILTVSFCVSLELIDCHVCCSDIRFP